MDAFVIWMEASTLGHVMRASGPWTYAIVNLAHILGISSLFGAVLLIDLRLLGVWRRVPLAALAAAAVPVAKIGFAIAAGTGICLLATKATEYIGNPFIAIKFPAIAIALVNATAVGRASGWRAREQRELTRDESRQLAMLGGISLAAWLTAVTAGRMIAYW